MALVTVQRSPTPSTTSSPCVSESGSGEDDCRSQPRSISESFLTVKGAALFLPRGNSPTPSSGPHISQRWNKHTGDLQKHLQTMFTVLRPEDTIRLAVRLESSYPQVTRYMVVVSTNGRQDTEECIVLGMDFYSSDSCCTVGLVLPLWSDTLIHLDGDGGFSVSTVNRVHVFKPVSVQAMWSALQSLHKACDVARCHNYYPGSLFLTWVSYYQSRISSNQFCINEWNAMQDVESHRANSPVLFTDLPTERERTERLIKMRLREIMMQKDLENVTSKEIRTELEMHMVCNLREFKEFIDNEMIVILGQMDSPTEIFEHVYLGSEWNASNLEELQNSGVRYILNVTREIDNFFPGMFEYHNIRVYDEEATNLLEYWNETYKFISKAKKAGAKCLVHCKMGVSRSASTVIAYAMKEYGWSLDAAFEYVKERRAVTKPNPSFMKQLEEYQGILLASKQRHNKLWRSHSDSDLSDRPELCKSSSHSLGRSDSQSNNNNSSPALHHFLGVAVLQALVSEPDDACTSTSDLRMHCNDACDLPIEVAVETACDDTLPPPSPQQHAAAPIPEEKNAAKAVISAPAIIPDLPPLLHILPPTPEVQRAHKAHTTPMANTENKPPELFLHYPEQSSSANLSPITAMSSDTSEQSPSDLQSEKLSPPSRVSNIPLLSSTGHSDDNNNPSEFHDDDDEVDGRSEADGSSSNHSSDSIDFFSAREKFLGLAQEDKTQTLSEQRTPSLDGDDNRVTEEDEESEHSRSQSEVSDDKLSPDSPHQPQHDNGISVRHIVTEIEAICHPTTSLTPPAPSSPSPVPPPSHELPLVRSDPLEGAEPKIQSRPTSPSPPPCDLPAGSVRRATEQLEQKLRQEMEMAAAQRSPLPSPCGEHPPVQSSDHPSCSKGKTTAEELNSSETANLQNTSLSHMFGAPLHPLSHIRYDTQTVDSCLHTSAQTQRDSGLQMSLDGVTIQESNPDENFESLNVRGSCDPDCADQKRLARGSQELERIRQTLRELQAFLHEGGGLEVPDTGPPHLMKAELRTDPDAARQLRQDRKSLPEPAGWHRANELEARIRQAGLTPPSLMKRSASLAKLDCLELSANDLSDLDLRLHARAAAAAAYSRRSFPTSPSHLDDTWKKQKVLTRNYSPQKTRLSPDDLSLSHSPERSEREETEGGGDGSLTTSSRQQGRAHSSRRLRKVSERKQRAATATLLYNTM